MIVEVRINEKTSQLNSAYDYLVPKELETKIFIGSRVIVPFGRSKRDAYVTGFKSQSKYELKPIISILPSEELSDLRIRLAKKMSKRYFCNLSECIKLMVNPELNKKLTSIDKVMEDKKDKKYIISSDYLAKNNIMEQFVNLAFLHKGEFIAKVLEDSSLSSDASLKSFSNKKEIIGEYAYKYLDIIIESKKQDKLSKKEYLKKLNLTEKQASCLLTILVYADITDGKIEIKNPKFLEISIFSKAILNAIINKGIIYSEEYMVDYDDFEYNVSSSNLSEPLELNSEQSKVYNEIVKKISAEEFSEDLIYGVTGSGKTEIYLQLIQKVIDMGKNAIVLVPEIALTPQITSRFNERFGDVISIMHSKLSQRRRYEEWKRVKEGNAKIVIGARSAIFAPLKDVGIIIIDEEHDSSYKSDKVPKYDAREIARFIAKDNNAVVVYGSATPDIVTYYMAKEGSINLHKLTKRVKDIKMPEVKIVDLKYEDGMLSQTLVDKIKANMERKEKSILFLNRRGHSSLIMCKENGHSEDCINCSISLTYHKNLNKLKCHYCGYTKNLPKTCSECGSEMVLVGVGTQKVDEELKIKIPGIKTLRMDLDSITAQMSHEEILKTFNLGDIDVLIGTQMVTKGHHFPKVTMASVIFADSMLNMDSYTASVKAFQNMVQLKGRSGRESKGTAIIQTYNIKDPIIQFAKNDDYESLYDFEITTRRMLKYPPFNDIIQIRVLSTKEELAKNNAILAKNSVVILKEKLLNEKYEKKKSLEELYEKDSSSNISERLKKINLDISSLEEMEVLDAAPFNIDRINNNYRWRVLIKAKLTPLIAKMIRHISLKIGGVYSVNASVDLNDSNL